MSPNWVQYDAHGRAGYVQVVFLEECGGYLVIHPQHGLNEWEENKVIGLLLAALGEAVELLPNQPDRPSPDALRNGEEWEFKTIRSDQLDRAIHHALRRGKKQSPNVLCLICHNEFLPYKLTLGIYRAVKFDLRQQLQRVALLFPDGKLIEMTREEIRSSSFIQKFNP